MARYPLSFRQRDVTAAIKAVRAGGLMIARVEVRKDAVLVIPGDPAKELGDACATDLMNEKVDHAIENFGRPAPQRGGRKKPS